MDYQKIRATVEQPLLTAFNDLSPSVPVFFDNITAAPANTTTEYVRVNVTFGLTNEQALTSNFDYVRGSLVIRVFTEKGRGPARNQTLLSTAIQTLETVQDTAKTNSGVFFSIGQINGPSFVVDETSPMFISRIDAGYKATVLS
jgi:hypothetical protein|tara:strand:+ start:462 stop:893 length:432 start_codon:yes stop_codon:yes gene_type:complete